MPTYPNASFTHQLVIPAGGIRPINAGGRFFRIVKSNVPLQIQRSGAAYQPYEQGDSEDLPDGETFTRLELKNATAVDAYVEIYVGYGRRDQDRQTVLPPKTEIRSIYADNLAPNEILMVQEPGLPGDIQRKALLVTNGSKELRLNILTAAGAVATVVFPEQVYPLEVSGVVGIQNPHGAAVEVFVSEVVYRA